MRSVFRMLEEIQSREKQSTEATFFFALSWGGGRPAAEGRGGGGHGDQGKGGVGDGGGARGSACRCRIWTSWNEQQGWSWTSPPTFRYVPKIYRHGKQPKPGGQNYLTNVMKKWPNFIWKLPRLCLPLQDPHLPPPSCWQRFSSHPSQTALHTEDCRWKYRNSTPINQTQSIQRREHSYQNWYGLVTGAKDRSTEILKLRFVYT